MEIIGYKCFNKDMTNRHGNILEVGKIYSSKGKVSFGNNSSHGFHMCKNMEDTFRYFDATNDEVSVCLVKGFGNIVEYNDEYYGYYDMYSVENIEILKKISRVEIINYALNLNLFGIEKFLMTFKLADEEIERFKEKFKKEEEILQYINYYQLKDNKAFVKKR